ncbi:MAG: ATP-binding protein [Acidobacteriota bacterium]|nr:ATP-binding protein [Acidobacteriota bacterium]
MLGFTVGAATTPAPNPAVGSDIRDRYTTLLDSIGDGFCVLEKVAVPNGEPPDYRYTEVNSAFVTHTGVANVLGRTMREVMGAECDSWFPIWDAVLNTGKPMRFEQEFVGMGLWLELYAFRVNDQPRRGVGVLFKDVTARKHADGLLRDSEERYRRLFESAKDGILILDFATGVIIDANPYMTELIGYSAGELAGKELWQIGLFADKAGSEAAVQQLREQGYIRFENLPLQSNRGRTVEVDVVGNAYREHRHKVIQCNIRDISERCALERTMHAHAEALAAIDRRKDEFLAMLSHELRAPLAPIVSAAQLLRLRENEGLVERQACMIIERQVGQLKYLVDDLLEVSRITHGKVHLRSEPAVLNTIIGLAVEAVTPLIEWRHHQLTVALPAEPIGLTGDAARLEQVVVNLLTNAAKYTDEGGRIWLSVDLENDTAVLRVRDNGIGISADLMPHVFDLFTQESRSLDRAQGGLGIGLSLVRRLVEAHGGTVAATSELGQGSEFVVRLPLTAPPPVRSLQSLPKATAACCQVLVVDDSVDTADSLALLLSVSGHRVRTAHDGPSALAAIAQAPPDAVVMDIGLPGIDGYEVARRVRRRPGTDSMVLVAMTGYGQERDRQMARDAGFNHHLVKPADLDELLRILAGVTASAAS